MLCCIIHNWKLSVRERGLCKRDTSRKISLFNTEITCFRFVHMMKNILVLIISPFYLSGDTSSTDWDKAWSTFKKKGKKTLFSEFSPNKYVTWNPPRSEYPLSEEVDPIKRAERSNLMLWTSPRFTLVGAIIIVLALLIYTLVVPAK